MHGGCTAVVSFSVTPAHIRQHPLSDKGNGGFADVSRNLASRCSSSAAAARFQTAPRYQAAAARFNVGVPSPSNPGLNAGRSSQMISEPPLGVALHLVQHARFLEEVTGTLDDNEFLWCDQQVIGQPVE